MFPDAKEQITVLKVTTGAMKPALTFVAVFQRLAVTFPMACMMSRQRRREFGSSSYSHGKRGQVNQSLFGTLAPCSAGQAKHGRFILSSVKASTALEIMAPSKR